VPTLARLAQAGNTAALALARDASAASNAANALNRLAQAAGHAAPGGHGGGHGHGGGTTVINYYVTVQGSVTSEGDLLTALQSRQLQRANNNWQGGWSLPNKRA
jgi:hypothetical protein